MGQILPGVVVLAFSLKGKNNYVLDGGKSLMVVLAFSLKGKNNYFDLSCTNSKLY